MLKITQTVYKIKVDLILYKSNLYLTKVYKQDTTFNDWNVLFLAIFWFYNAYDLQWFCNALWFAWEESVELGWFIFILFSLH